MYLVQNDTPNCAAIMAATMNSAIHSMIQHCVRRGRVGQNRTLEGQRVFVSGLTSAAGAKLNDRVFEDCGPYNPETQRYRICISNGEEEGTTGGGPSDAKKKPQFCAVPAQNVEAAMFAVCAMCGTVNARSRCSRCKAVSYCGPDCQRQHWASHKKPCKQATKEQAAAAAAWEAYRAAHGGPLPGRRSKTPNFLGGEAACSKPKRG